MVDKYFLKKLTDNLKRPCVQINVGGAMVAKPAFMFGARLQMRLEAALNLVWLYKKVVRAITRNMIQWDHSSITSIISGSYW